MARNKKFDVRMGIIAIAAILLYAAYLVLIFIPTAMVLWPYLDFDNGELPIVSQFNAALGIVAALYIPAIIIFGTAFGFGMKMEKHTRCSENR